jgi:hypothetical protein
MSSQFFTHRDLTHATTKWQRCLYGARQASSPVLGEAVSGVADQLEEVGHCANADNDASDFGAEVFGRLYGNAEKMGTPDQDTPWATPAQDMLTGLPEFAELLGAVAGDPDLSALATTELLKAVSGRLQELSDQAEDEPQDDDQEGYPGGPVKPHDGPVGAEDLIRSALRRGCKKGQEAAEDAREALSGLSPGLGSIPATHEQEDPSRLALAERLKNDPRLSEIMKRAGRITALANARKKTQRVHGYEEVVDIERGADLGRMLASELAMLADDDLELLKMADIVERKAIQYELTGHEPLGQGPVILLVDESGSMWGEPQSWARAIALACLSHAEKDGRRIDIVGFDTEVRSIHTWDAKAKEGTVQGIVKDFYLPTSTMNLGALAMSLATQCCGGGTSFDAPIEKALELLEGNERADFILLTDGEGWLGIEHAEKLAEMKASSGLHMFGITLNGGTLTGAMGELCDEQICLDSADDVGKELSKVIPR